MMRSERWCQWCVAVLWICIAAANGAAAGVIYVDGAAAGADDGSSWTDAHVYLQDALTAAESADKPVEIRVAQGVHAPYQGDTLPAFVWGYTYQLLNGVTLKGGYAGILGSDPNERDPMAHATILSDGAEDDGIGSSIGRGDPIVTGDLTDSTAVIDGFTFVGAGWESVSIRNGSPTLIDCRFTGGATQSAIHASDCNSVLIGCVFEGTDKRAIEGWDGHLTLRDCSFVGCGSEAIRSGGSLDLLRCSFTDNHAAIFCGESLVARRCTFARNVGNREVVRSGRVSRLTDCSFIGNVATGSGTGALRVSGDFAALTRCAFIGNTGAIRGSGALYGWVSVLNVSQCLFVGNSGGEASPGAIFHHGAILRVANCTFSQNRGDPYAIRYSEAIELTQTIIRGQGTPLLSGFEVQPPVVATYCNIEGGYEGQGNVDLDPGFVAPGHWDLSGTPEDPNDDVWVMGDYHLKSQAGHWDRESESWVLDDITSPCIDLGDPNGPLGSEPFPNGGYVNLGAYGGTSQASRSYFGGPVCETQIAGDINGDCKVDDLDMDILTAHWLMPEIGKANIPPTVRVISPADGAELTAPTPIVLHAEALDSDGAIVSVRYAMEHHHDSGTYRAGGTIGNASGQWRRERDWDHISYDGVYTLWFEAVDDDGAVVVSEPVTITLHP